jgi:hypothetical protein
MNLIITTIPWQDGNDHLWEHCTLVDLPDGRSVVAFHATDLLNLSNGGAESYLSVHADLGWAGEDAFSLDQWCSMFPSLSFIDLSIGGIAVKISNFCAITDKLKPSRVYAHTHSGLMWFDSDSGVFDNGSETFTIQFTDLGIALVRLTDSDTLENVICSRLPFTFALQLSSGMGVPSFILDSVLMYLTRRGGFA